MEVMAEGITDNHDQKTKDYKHTNTHILRFSNNRRDSEIEILAFSAPTSNH